MRQLVIDTATEALSIALIEDGACIAERHELVGRGHAERLLPSIAAFPDGGRADRIAVDVGPGSFTGVRVGLAAARALAFAWAVPLTGYGALAMVAHLAHELHRGSEPVCVAMTGGHGELFWQLFDPDDLTPRTDLASTPIVSLACDLPASDIYGSGARVLVDSAGHGRAHVLHPRASAFASLPARFHIADVAAQYGRDADAIIAVATGSAHGA